MPLLGRLARMAGHLFRRYANHRLPLATLYLVAFLRCFGALAMETKTAECLPRQRKNIEQVLLFLAIALSADLPPFPLPASAVFS